MSPVDIENNLTPREYIPPKNRGADKERFHHKYDGGAVAMMPVVFIGLLLVSGAISFLLYTFTNHLILAATFFTVAVLILIIVFLIKLLFPALKMDQTARITSSLTAGDGPIFINSYRYPMWVSDLKRRFIFGNQAFDDWMNGHHDHPVMNHMHNRDDFIQKLTDDVTITTPYHGCLTVAFSTEQYSILLSAYKKQDKIYWSALDVRLIDQTIKKGVFFPAAFHGILSTNKTAYVFLSHNGDCIYANDIYKKLAGLSDDEALFAQYDQQSGRLHLKDGRTLKLTIIEENVEAQFPSPFNGKLVFFISPTTISHVETADVSDEMAVILQHKLFINMPLAMAVVNGSNKIVATNERFQQSFSDQMKGQAIQHLVQEENQKDLAGYIKSILSGDDKVEPLNVHYNTTKELEGQIYATQYQGQGGENYAVIFCLDKTVEKNLEQQFVQAQKMQAVGQLAGGVAHDFNNLLTAIIGFCDLLLMRHAPGDNSFADINQIKQNANRAANLVRQLLAFSRQQTLRPKALNITDVLSDVSNLIRRLIGENIVFSLNLKRDLPMVRADQGQLEQVVMNLAVNARDAMQGSGKLEIVTRYASADDDEIIGHDIIEHTDYVVIDVKDTGSGMSKEIQEKIFDPFFTTKDVGEGTGLGLSTVYGIIKQTGGYVFVDSTEGQGTTFTIYLPVQSSSEGADDRVSEPEEETSVKNKDLSGKGCILLVEDEAPVRMFATRALENKGYKVLEADSGETALDILNEQEHHIDLLITDVIMPIVDGPTLYRRARELHSTLPIIFISGYAEDIVRKDLEGGDFDFLAKPFSLNDLAEKVKLTLD